MRTAIIAAAVAFATAAQAECLLLDPPVRWTTGDLPPIDYWSVDDPTVWCKKVGYQAPDGNTTAGCTLHTRPGSHPTEWIIIYPAATPLLGCSEDEIIRHEEAHVRSKGQWTHE